jgi:hypothetical protein
MVSSLESSFFIERDIYVFSSNVAIYIYIYREEVMEALGFR